MFEGIKKRFSNNEKAIRFDKINWLFNDSKDTQEMTTAEEFFNNSLYLNKAINKRAEVMSGIKFKAVNEDGDEIEEVQQVLEKPNNLVSGRDFIEVIQTHYDVYGQFFIWKEMSGETLDALHILKPKKIETKFTEDGRVERFELKNGDSGKKQTYQPEEVIWQHRPDPGDFTKPQSLVTRACYDALRAEIELRSYQAKVARSGGRFDSIISFDGEMTESKLEEAKERYKKRRNEARRSKEGTTPFFAGGNVEVKDLNRSPKEIDYLESKKTIMEEISTITGVPRTLLSSFEGVKYSNAQEARKTFLKETIKPLADKLTETLTRNLPATVTYEDFVPEDHEEKMSRLQTGAETGTTTINERRKELGYEELEMEEADVPLINMNRVPIDETTPKK